MFLGFNIIYKNDTYNNANVSDKINFPIRATSSSDWRVQSNKETLQLYSIDI